MIHLKSIPYKVGLGHSYDLPLGHSYDLGLVKFNADMSEI